jgi:hypothetical protein
VGTLMEALALLILAAWLIGAVVVSASRPPASPRPVARVRPQAAIPARRVRTEVEHLLYCYLWADTLQPRYYGVSNEPPVRARRHENDPDDQWWFRQTTGVMVPIRWYPNRAAAFAAERAAVRAGAAAGEDLANQVHHPDGRFRRAIR